MSLAFIIYVYKEADPDVKQCLVLSNLLCNCGIDCDIDQYYRNHDILDWVNWVSERINFCISRKGYILLECSQAMYTSLENTKDNHRIQMAVAHVDCFTLRNFIRKHTDRFIPFYTDTKSCDYTPGCLSLKPIYHLPINLLPENFALEILDKRSVLDLTILENPNFVSLKRLVATLTGQQEIAKPAIGKPCKYSNLFRVCIFAYVCIYINKNFKFKKGVRRNCDKTGLYYCLLPHKTLASSFEKRANGNKLINSNI